MQKAGGFVARKDLTDYRVDRARADPRPLSRLGDRRPAAARGVGRAHHPDAEHPRRLRHQAPGLRHGRHAPPAGRGAEDRLRRPRRRRAATRPSSTCRSSASPPRPMPTSAAPGSTSRARRRWTSGLLGQGRRRHHAPHRGRRQGQRRRHHPDHQQPVRRALHRARASAWCRTTTCRTSIRGPGNALSIAPGKRVTTSMAPMMALRDGRLVYALGLPGGRKHLPLGAGRR